MEIDAVNKNYAAGLVSSPPARIVVVVGGDTNNGYAEPI